MSRSKCFFLVLLLLFLLNSFSYATILLDRVVAVVNQEVITWSELYRAMESDASPQLKALKDDEKRRIFKESEAVFIETLINLKLQLQEAKSMGMIVTEEETNEAIDSIMKKYGMSESVFKESLVKEGYGMDDYRKRLQEQILVSKIVNQQIRSKIIVTDQDINRFIEQNKNSGDSNEGYHISQVFFKRPKRDEDKIKVEEIAGNIVTRLKDGETFSELAKNYSEDPSGSSGGDLGFIKKNHLMKEFSEAIVRMKPGDVSNPFWTDRGLHIIKLNEKVEARDLNEIREDARRTLSNKLFVDKYNVWIKSLREKAFIEIRLQ